MVSLVDFSQVECFAKKNIWFWIIIILIFIMIFRLGRCRSRKSHSSRVFGWLNVRHQRGRRRISGIPHRSEANPNRWWVHLYVYPSLRGHPGHFTSHFGNQLSTVSFLVSTSPFILRWILANRGLCQSCLCS